MTGESGSAFNDSVVEQRLVESSSCKRIVFSPGRLRRLKIGSEVAPGEQMDVSFLSGTRYQTKTYLHKRLVCRVVVSGSLNFGSRNQAAPRLTNTAGSCDSRGPNRNVASCRRRSNKTKT